MRQRLLATVAATLIGLAVACGSGETSEPAPTATRAATATPTAAPAATGTSTPGPTPTPRTVDPVAQGKSLSARNGCASCHSADGSASIGPTWKGLYGKTGTLADGSEVTVDDSYLLESIVDPDAKIVKGFTAGIMPRGFGDKLPEDELQAIIEYIKTLK